MLDDFQFNVERMWRLCLKCVWALDMPPTTNKTWQNLLHDQDDTCKYGLAVAQLLLGTAAQESAFVWERQRTPNWDGLIGGFSKWQLESASILNTLRSLKARPIRLEKVTQFLFADPHATTNWVDLPIDTILWMLRLHDNDYLGVMLAREHYRRIAFPVPSGVEAQAMYWKQYYNTSLGKGKVTDYIANWNKYCAPVMGI